MITVALLTISDSVHAGTRSDESGPALRRRCEELGWQVVESSVVPDEEAAISAALINWVDRAAAALILSTGGTGISARDRTPEATEPVLHRQLPGIAELMRAKGLAQTPFSVLSRGLAGTRDAAFIVNLPGSPRGAVHSLSAIEHLVPHVVDLLAGKTSH